jgi:predicted nuclease with TOPRIM domain
LFNLDNRLELIIGENPTSNLIPKAKREGFVDCLARRCCIFTWQNIKGDSYDLREKQDEGIKEIVEKVNWLNTDEYNGYVENVEKYLEQLAQAFCTNSTINVRNQNEIEARKTIDKLFVEFFLAGDRKIIDLAKCLNMKNILDN